MQPKLRVGLVLNPFAGLGGSVALKGSDGVAEEAMLLGAAPKAAARLKTTLEAIAEPCNIHFVSAGGAMGAELLAELGLHYQVAYEPAQPSTSMDTHQAVKAITDTGCDLLLFVGGDGTARDVANIVPDSQLVLGVPAGVKIHSGVYGVTPLACAAVINQMVAGKPLSTIDADVMDIDETLFREGKVKAKWYSEMLIPKALEFIQSVKVGGIESDEMVQQEIAEFIIDEMQDDTYYVMGSGSTIAVIMENLSLTNTLLGVDIVYNRQLVQRDVTAADLEALLQKDSPIKLVITAIGGQGHILGRGNQQLSAHFVRAIGKKNMLICATKNKILSLNGAPLISDSGDKTLDRALSGSTNVICGYQHTMIYPVWAGQ